MHGISASIIYPMECTDWGLPYRPYANTKRDLEREASPPRLHHSMSSSHRGNRRLEQVTMCGRHRRITLLHTCSTSRHGSSRRLLRCDRTWITGSPCRSSFFGRTSLIRSGLQLTAWPIRWVGWSRLIRWISFAWSSPLTRRLMGGLGSPLKLCTTTSIPSVRGRLHLL